MLFGRPEVDFSVGEIISHVEAGSGGVQRELKRLGGSGLIDSRRVGNQRRYRANPTSPIFNELCSIVRKTIGVVDPLRGALAPLVDQMELALLYGSTAKGTAHAQSDIDLLVVSDSLTLEALFRSLEGVELQLGRQIQATLYTRAEFDNRRAEASPFLRKVLAGEYVVLVGELSDTRASREPGGVA